VLEVVAGVVLAQPAQRGVDAAIGHHGLDAQYQVAHVAVAKHRGAARVSGKVAADLAAALGADPQREQPARLFGGSACPVQRDAGLQRERVVDGVDLEHAVHA
jgi:hypothetical protein